MCDLMREYAAPWVSFYRLQHPVFHSITNLPTWRRYCGNACDDNSVTYLNLERAASSCAGSQSSLLKHSRPVSLSLSSTHSKHAHTPRHREREREEARAREKEKGERGKGHSCVSSSPGPFHLVIILTTPTPPPLPFKNTTHTSVLLDLVQQDWRWRDRAEAEGWDGRKKKECRGSVSHTHTLSPHSCTHTHTRAIASMRPKKLQIRVAQTGRQRGGAPAFPPLHWVLVPHWHKIHMDLGFLFWLSWQARCRSHQVHLICTAASKKLQIRKITSSRISLILSPYA